MRKTTIGAVAEIYDGPHATPTRTTVGPYFLNISSLNNGRLDLELSDHVSGQDFDKWTKRVTPRAGDLLFSYETRLGEAALMPEGISACLGRRMALLRFDTNQVDPRYFLYMYLSPQFKQLIESRTIHGATVNRIALSTMADWTIQLPGLSKQRAVAEVLGALDDKIAANRERAQTASELADVMFSQVCSQRSDAPKVLLSEVVSTQYGLTTSALVNSEGPRLVRVTDINKKPWIEWDGSPSCAPSDDDLVKYRLQVGDILVARMADPGKAAFVDAGAPDAVFASYLVRLKPRDPLDSLFVYYFLRSPVYRAYAEGAMTGSVQRNMNARVIVDVELALPTTVDRDRFNANVQKLRSVMGDALAEIRILTKIRDSLLPQLMSGKLRVRDAEKQVEAVL